MTMCWFLRQRWTKLLEELGLVPDVIKIDVEGAELGVLKGGTKCFERSKADNISLQLIPMNFGRIA